MSWKLRRAHHYQRQRGDYGADPLFSKWINFWLLVGLALIFNFYVGSIIYIIANSSFEPISRYYVFLYIIINTAIFDTFAYLIGTKYGKHKMIPNISPNKSWEGFIAGLIISVIISFVLFNYIMR